MARILVALFLVTTNTLRAQVSDAFSDGDFTSNPIWSGHDSEFVIDASNQLRLNNLSPSSNNESYLSLPSAVIENAVWEFKVGFDGLSSGGLSGSNKMFIYLVSDKADLESDPNGYYVLVGNTNDEVSLYSTTSSTPLIDGTDDVTQSSSAFVSVRVTRDDIGNWELLVDTSGGNNFISEGTSSNTDFEESAYFGILCDYSSTRSTSFFFDDFEITGSTPSDIDPPFIQSVTAVSDTQIEVAFNEPIDQTTAESVSNYVLDGITITTVSTDSLNPKLVHLTTEVMTNGATYVITINNIEDESGNVIATNSQHVFQYLVFEEAVEFDVVVNEFMPDPNPVIGLPDAEFVELYNRSDKFLNLENWILDGQTLGNYQFNPNSYVIIVDDNDEALFSSFSNVLTISTLSLSNSSADSITLKDDNESQIHGVAFQGSTGGISTELINPNGPDYSQNNYGLSTDLEGGTPGEQNSIFDDTPDTTSPIISSIVIISSTELDIIFNEPIDKTTSESILSYAIDGGIAVTTAIRDENDNSIIHLAVTPLVSGEIRTLTINDVQDLSGNVIMDNSMVDFEYIETEEAVAGDVLINEFYAIPNDEAGIPNAEFIELLNVSDKFINLENWTFSDATGISGSFPPHILRPGGLVILTASGEGSPFILLGNVLEVPSYRSLNNGGDDLTITNESGVDIFSLNYTSVTSGISTELINPNGPDYSQNNYGQSIDPNGGTPGEQNSIFDDTPDTTSPVISTVVIISSTELDIIFDEPIDKTTSESILSYSIDGGIAVTIARHDENDNSIIHLAVTPLVSGEIRTLTINDVQDLSGNVIIDNSTIDFEYIETEEAVAGDVLINEFYAIPSKESGIPNAEFIELLNVSDKFIDLQDWTISDASNTSSSIASFILRPDSLVILTEKDNGILFSFFGDVVEVGGFPALNNSGDDITITSADTIDIFSISYSSATSGICTELINPDGPDFSENNYSLSIDPDGGTPGKQNSIFDDTPDTTKPVITELQVISATKLKLFFSEPISSISAENITNYSIDGGISIDSVQFEQVSKSTVNLFVSELVSTENRSLTINNIQDLSGNVIKVNTSIEFVFIETVNPEQGDILVNEFMANPLNESGVINGEFIELLNNSSNYFDLENWTMSDASGTSGYLPSKIFGPNELLILIPDDNPELFEGLGEVLVVPGFRSLNNSSDDIVVKDESGAVIFELSYSESELGKSAELVNPNDPCISENSYSTSIVNEGSTPGQINSVFDNTPDTKPPTIVSFNFDQSLTINFSETMDALSLMNGTYQVSNLTVSTINVGILPTNVDLFFGENLEAGLVYEMNVYGVTDCWGNLINEIQINFGIGRDPAFNEIIITEIFSDPEPSSGLPEVEFIEIHNTTSNAILKTENLMFSDANNVSQFPPASLLPGEYYVVTSTSNVSSFPGVDVIGISGFPSLSNAGEQLYLSMEENLIFSVNYTNDWHDDEKSDGGYSLEIRDISNPCMEEFNWGSSGNASGGTPGLANSISENVPDNFGPEVTEVIVLSADAIRIDLNENLDPMVGIGLISFDPDLIVESIGFDYNFPKSISISLEESLTESVPHTFQLTGIFDCNGNEVQENNLIVVLSSDPILGDILLSEVLFNPRTNGVDFVELYNASTNYIDLDQWQLARITDVGVSDEKLISGQIVMGPGEYFAFTTDVEVLFDNYPQADIENIYQIASLPTYANDTGNVVLLNSLGEIQELFRYEDEFHYDLLENDDGVSLERISFVSETNDPNNWRSAASAAGFATPGGPNSQATSNQGVTTGSVEIEPKVFIPGNSGSGRDFTTINYRFDLPGKFANITIYDQAGRMIKKIAEGALLSTDGFVRWDGTTNSGEMTRIGYYVVLFEVFDSSGNSDVIKETVVVGRDF